MPEGRENVVDRVELLDEGIESFVDEMESNTLGFVVRAGTVEFSSQHGVPIRAPITANTRSVELVAHALDTQGLSLPPLPWDRPFITEMPETMQMEWLITAYREMHVEYDERFLLIVKNSSPPQRAKLLEMIMSIRHCEGLSYMRPLSVMKTEDGQYASSSGTKARHPVSSH
jgi:hypothetical protein